MFCIECGAELPESAKFCPSCGSGRHTLDTPSPPIHVQEAPTASVLSGTASEQPRASEGITRESALTTPFMGTNSSILALFAGCVVFGIVLNVATSGWEFRDPMVALVLGGILFLWSAIGGVFGYAIKKSRTQALWGWTIVAILGMVVFIIGGVRGMMAD